MKVNVNKTKTIEEEIDIELPIYGYYQGEDEEDYWKITDKGILVITRHIFLPFYKVDFIRLPRINEKYIDQAWIGDFHKEDFEAVVRDLKNIL